MALKFTLEEEKTLPKTAGLSIDSDGDLRLRIGDLDVLYIEASTGRVIRFFLDDVEMQRLPGLTFDEGYIKDATHDY